jgi:hypothetical protein
VPSVMLVERLAQCRNMDVKVASSTTRPGHSRI